MDLLIELKYKPITFTETRTNILMDRAQVPSTMGLQAPTRANVGKASSNGFEVTLDYNQDFSNDLFIGARANFFLC